MKRPSNRSLSLIGAALWLALGTAALAEQKPASPNPASSLSAGQVTKNFSLPQYQEGKLTAMITGSEARVISPNRTEITDMKVDLYQDGKVDTSIASPKSDYWTADNKMRTRYTVTITRPDMVITAQTMEWEVKEQRGVLRQNVKVVLNSLDLAKPATSPSPDATAPLIQSIPDTTTSTDTTPFQLAPTTAPATPNPFQ